MIKKIKLYLALLLALVLMLPIVSFDSYAQTNLSDIQGHQYQESIEYLESQSIVGGYPDGTFKPNQSINRAEMLKILMEAFSDDEIESNFGCFKDVEAQWFAKYICNAKEKGIVQGYATGNFRPGQKVNMAEALKMGIETFDLNSDQYKGDEWFEQYVEFAHQNNIFSKYSYLPSRQMTRGEMSFFIHQLILNKKGSQLLTGKRNAKSMGCGVNPPQTAPTKSTVNGVEREYITVIPKNYNSNKPLKLIFAFHGRTNPNTQVRGYYKVEQAAGDQAIMIYPAGLPAGGNSRNWSDPGDAPDQLRDFTLFDQLLEEFSNNYCIDLDEVYVVGHSLGAWFTNSLACFRGNVIRGIGSLGGGTTVGNCTGPVASMIWHNPKDRLVAFSQGEAARDQYIRQNQCSYESVSVDPVKGNCVQYNNCYTDAPLIWCPHNVDYDYRGTYYPHTWPNFTGQEIWRFFESLQNK